jgi:nucleotide-binding universal stress UspA family protein
MKKIIVPVDFSDCAKRATEYAFYLAIDLGATVELFYVCPSNPDMESEDSITDSFQLFLDQMDSELLLDVDYVLCHSYGELIESLSAEVKRDHFDLLITGTQGFHLFTDEIPGSRSAWMIGNISIPVLVIPDGVFYERPKYMVYALDYEDIELESVKHMQAMANLFHAHLQFIHVDRNEEIVDEEQYRVYSVMLAEILKDENSSFALRKAKNLQEGIHKLKLEEKMDWLVFRTQLKEDNGGPVFSNSRISAGYADTPLLVWPSPQIHLQ